MLLHASQSQLLMIDLQERLLPHIEHQASILQQNLWVLRLARQMQVPLTLTEHCPQSLGKTEPALRQLLSGEEILTKAHFSAWREPAIVERLASQQRSQIIITGAEAHVCCLQTSADLLAQGYQVFLLEEAIGARKPTDKHLALQRLQQQGAQLVSREMLAFEWLATPQHPDFKQVLAWIK